MNKRTLTRGVATLALMGSMGLPLASAAHAVKVDAPAQGTTHYTATTVNGFVNVKVTPAQEAQLRSSIIATAASQAGVPYLWGGMTPSVGMDCSGLVGWTYKQQGITLPRTVATIRPVVRSIPASQVKPGDLVFSGFTQDGKHHTHVGIVVDPVKKTFWHAPNVGDVVRLGSYSSGWYNGSTFGTVISPTVDTDATAPSTPGTSTGTGNAPGGSTTTPSTPTTGSGSVVVTTPGGSTNTGSTVVTAPVVTYATTTRSVKPGATLNVRASASAKSASSSVVKGGTKLTGNPMSNGWFKITSGSLSGKYVSNAYLGDPKVKAGTNLNVRSAASASSKLVGTLKSGTPVVGVLQGSWFKITSGPYSGKYVSAGYLV